MSGTERPALPLSLLESRQIESELAPEIPVPLHKYTEAACLLFPELFVLGQAMREGKETSVKEFLPRLKESMPVFYYHFDLDKHPQRLVKLMQAFGVDEQGRLPESDERVDPRILEFFHQFSLVPGNDPKDRSTVVLIPGVEAEDAQDAPYLDTIKKYYGQIVAARQPQTDWYTELAEASIPALLKAKETEPSLGQILPEQVDGAGYSQGGRLVQGMILEMAYADLQWGTKLLFDYARNVRTTAIIAPASGVDELPWRSQAAVKAVDWIADKFGFWIAKRMQMRLVPDSGEYEIGRSISITRGQQIGDWWRLFHEEIRQNHEVATIEAFLDSLGLPKGWLMLIASKADDIVGPSGLQMALLLAAKWYPLVNLNHRQVPYDEELWRQIRLPASQRRWGPAELRNKPGATTWISPLTER